MKIDKHLNKIIEDECRFYGITIDPIRFKSAVGRAWIDLKRIKIPNIVDIKSFYIALHEIGHIVNGKLSPITTMNIWLRNGL